MSSRWLRRRRHGDDGIDETARFTIAADADSARHERIEVLGEGGTGKLWLLRDERIGRRVAQKELLESIDDPHMRARFLREARLQVQVQLGHPAVVPVYDLGVSADGKLYFTMKRVRGVTLAGVVHESRPARSKRASLPAVVRSAWRA